MDRVSCQAHATLTDCSDGNRPEVKLRRHRPPSRRDARAGPAAGISSDGILRAASMGAHPALARSDTFRCMGIVLREAGSALRRLSSSAADAISGCSAVVRLGMIGIAARRRS